MDQTVANGPSDSRYLLSPMPLTPDAHDNGYGERIHYRRAAMRAVVRAVFAERGYVGVHVRDLARRCGVSAQTLYNNLGNREEILLSATDELMRAQIAQASAKGRCTGCNFLFTFCDLSSRLMEVDREYSRAILTAVTDRQYRSPVAERIDQLCIDAYRRELQSMRRAGNLKHWVDVDALAATLQITICGVLAIHAGKANDPQQLRDDLRATVGLLLLGVTRNEDAAAAEAAIRRVQVKVN